MADPRYIADQMVEDCRRTQRLVLRQTRLVPTHRQSFADILDIDEELTPPKALEVKQFCSDFIASDEGKQALVEQKAARKFGYRR